MHTWGRACKLHTKRPTHGFKPGSLLKSYKDNHYVQYHIWNMVKTRQYIIWTNMPINIQFNDVYSMA